MRTSESDRWGHQLSRSPEKRSNNVSGDSTRDGNNGQQIRPTVDVEEGMEKTLDDNAAAAEEYDEVEEEEAVENVANANEG
jgi:hypothetical protein